MNKRSLFRRSAIFFLLTSFTFFSSVFSQPATATFKGIVIDASSRRPLQNVTINIRNTSASVKSNSSGEFAIENVPPGVYDVEFKRDQYQSLILARQKISTEKATFVTVELASALGESEYVYYIGGIEVTASRELLPETIETTTSINSGDIEHIQATSLGDVLDLVPGVEMKNQPALKTAIKAKIRDAREENPLTSFSTKIIIDDIPFSNNANLQGAAFKTVYTGTGDGIDLREIPADNIESVDVIRGIAPANYGDFMGGLINIRTKTYDQLFYRLKTKTNPDTKEINFGGGFPLARTNVNYNLNVAFSERDIRKDYDNAQRLTGQIILKNRLFENRLILKNQFKYYSLFENVKQDPQDPNKQKSISKGYRFIYGNEATYHFATKSEISSNFFLNYRRADSYQQFMVQGSGGVISTLLENGTMAGIKLNKSYLYFRKTVGDELSVGQTFAWNSNFATGKFFHRLMLGNDFLYENNYGPGLTFDISWPPPQKGVRPRSFDDVPGLFQHSLYFNDQILGRLGNEFILNVGIRYERYNAANLTDLKFFKSNNGAFVNPRINFSYQLAKGSRFRLGFGKTSKAPALHHIFSAPYYFDVQDVFPIDENILIRDSLITTYKFDQANLKLKGFQEQKFELSLDQQLGKVGLSLTGFYIKRTAEPRTQIYPFIYHVYSRPNWPDLNGSYVYETLMDYYKKTINGGYSISTGLECTLKSHQIQKINMDFAINAAYVHVDEKTHGLYGDKIYLCNYTLPFYNNHGKWTENLVFSYQINYLAKILGLWLTLTAQHVPFYRYKKLGENDTLAVAYYDGKTDQIINIDEKNRLDEQYEMYRVHHDYQHYKTKIFDSKWIFNISMSKSLFSGAEVSLFVNNFWDDRAIQENPSSPGVYLYRNPEIFYGIEFSVRFDKVHKE